jgi:hypothetical protein
MALPLPKPSAVLDLTRFAVGQATGSAAAVAAVPARVFGLLDGVDALIKRINAIADRAEAAVTRTEQVLDEAEDAVRQVAVISAAATLAIEEATRVASAARVVVAEAERVSTAAGVLVSEAEQVSSAAGALVSEVAQVSTAAGVVVAEVQQVAGKAAGAMARAELIASTADELLTAYETTLRKGAPMASRFIEQLSPEEVDAAIRLIDELPKLTEHIVSDVLPIMATLDRVGPDIHDLLGVTRDLKLAVAGIPGLKMLARRGDRRGDDGAER